MIHGWPDRSPGVWAVGLVAVIAASSLLLAQAAGKSAQQPSSDDKVLAADAQPAQGEGGAASESAADEAGQERLLSGLIGSKHDFTAEGEVAGDLCVPCHAPHIGAAPAPRLDRQAVSARLLQPYQGIEAELDGWSLMCLGCHDGTVAQDIYFSAHAVEVVSQLGNSRLGSAGAGSHPIGIKYPSSDEDYHPLAAVEAAGLSLPDGRIQCTTCHDAHNTHRHEGMLKITNRRSGMCLTCHRL